MATAATTTATPATPALHALPFIPTTAIRANNGTIPAHQLGWLTPTPSSTPLPELRHILKSQGYVWLKHLLPRPDVLAMRSHFFSQFTTTGLLAPGSDPVLGLYNTAEDISLHRGVGGGNPSSERELQILTDAHVTEEYGRFAAHPALRDKVREIMGWEEEVMLRRTLLRHNVPGGSSTGVHYDRLFLRGGDAFFLTAWVPVGDVSHRGGGLYYLEDSVRLGEALEADFSARAEAAGFSEQEKVSAFNANMSAVGYLADNNEDFPLEHAKVCAAEGRDPKQFRWLVADFEAGDVVFHDPCILHGSLGNDDEQGRIRLSTDLRFYEKKAFDEGRADNRWMRRWTATDSL